MSEAGRKHRLGRPRSDTGVETPEDRGGWGGGGSGSAGTATCHPRQPPTNRPSASPPPAGPSPGGRTTWAMITPDLLVRYYRVWDLNLHRGSWYRQFDHGDDFDLPTWTAGPDDVENMLAGRYWIGCAAPASGRIRWLRFDLDCTEEAEVQNHLARYEALRTLLGRHRRPVVWQTPSGRGLRVVYPIPETNLKNLITGKKSGLVANVLRGAGLEPKAGRLEIYPQKKQVDRLPLGRDMPLLDPDTLQPLFGPMRSFDADVFERSLKILEGALAAPFTDLPPELGRRSKLELRNVQKPGEGDSQIESLFISTAGGGVTMGESLERLITKGLPGRRSRYESEFLIAMTMHLDPNRFAQYGVRAPTDDVRIAQGVAAWLAANHNDRSTEWSKQLSHGSVQSATAFFAHRYLDRNRDTGEHMIDRAQRAAMNIDPLSLEVRQLARSERGLIMDLAERHYPAGAQRYRCEVWLASFLRSVKENMRYRRENGRERFVRQAHGAEQVEVEILAEWLENSPYGSGECSRTRRTRYLDYLQILIDAGVVELAREYSHHRDARLSRARTYLVRTPETALLRDLVYGGRTYSPWIVKRVLPRIVIDGNRGCALPDDAYHDLHLAVSSIDLRGRYGRDTAVKIQYRAGLIEKGVARVLRKAGVELLRAA